MRDQPLISLESVDLGYRRKTVVAGVDLLIRRGDYWVLLGPNGRGKTTLVHALIGSSPLAGRVRHGEDFNPRQDIGFVPQSSRLHPSLPMTVAELVGLGMVNLRLTRGEWRERLAAALATVALGEHAQESFWHLSGGQRQRALIARALVRRPALLILDEPTTGLDLAAEEALLTCIDGLYRELTPAIVLVTHDLSLALRHATHVALFQPGRLETGTAAEMLTRRRLGAAFGVTPGSLSILAVEDGA